jgi:hypothetical protein
MEVKDALGEAHGTVVMRPDRMVLVGDEEE